ncbi:BTAD domain-containing putative transcriptional regulator [Actinomycetes bacterium KLBMP 9797]
MATQFQVLGDVKVRVDGRAVDVGHSRQRCVLVALLVDANRQVPVDQLVDRVWAHAPPQRARGALYNYLSRLRQVFAGSDDVRIVRQLGGYVLHVDALAVDLHEFHHLVGQAQAADNDGEALALLEQALGLWRGEAFATLDTPWLNTVRSFLDRQRLAVELDRNDLALRRGDHSRLLAELTAGTASHPLDERLAGQLILALYRGGRQAEALAHYERMRRRLADELGADPSPPLQDLHRQILTADPTLAGPSPAIAHSSSERLERAPVPRQLPAPPRSFVGRTRELIQLNDVLETADDQPTTVIVSAVSGTAGVGKTALALYWAHLIADRFPHGQLYVNLRGYDQDQPMTAADALAGFLRALGVAGQDIPFDLDERAARYRTEIAGRRMLVVLDNASSVEQVRPLLPGAPSCLVLTTSRDSLAGLVALDGASRLNLDLLPQTDAFTLLHRLIGQRVEVEPRAAAVLAEQCVRLPLALRVAAELAASRPECPLADLVAELADEQRRLDQLDGGDDPHSAVAAVFSWSYRQLTTDIGRLFRLLGLHAGPDVDAYAAAALIDTTVDHARQLMDRLARAHLVERKGRDRYDMHDLLRAYAHREAHSQDHPQYRKEALTRLFDYYLTAAATATKALYPSELHRQPDLEPAHTPVPSVHDPITAQSWLNIERNNLVACCVHAARHGLSAHATRLAKTLFRFLDTGGYCTDALTIYTSAVRAARDTDDQSAEAYALFDLGIVHMVHGHYDDAVAHHALAIALHRETGDQAGEAYALWGAGIVYRRQGHHQTSAQNHRQALTLFREIEDRYGEADALQGLGLVEARLGEYGAAADHHRQALTLFRDTGDRYGEAHALHGLGSVETRLGQYGPAAAHHRQALALFLETRDLRGQAHVHDTFGLLEAKLGNHQAAAVHHQEAHTLHHETGDRHGEASALNGLGEAALAIGESDEARARHAAALSIATEIGAQEEQARAHKGLALAHRRADPPPRARSPVQT